jgi:hypothetical protein
MPDAQHHPSNTFATQQIQLMDDERLSGDLNEGFRHRCGDGAQARGDATSEKSDRQHSY